MVTGGHAWLLGGMHGCWGHVWLLGGMHGCWGVHGCGGHAWDMTRYGVGGTHPTGMHSCFPFFFLI